MSDVNFGVVKNLVETCQKFEIPEVFLKGREFNTDADVLKLVSDWKDITSEMQGGKDKPDKDSDPNKTIAEIQAWAKGTI